MLFLLTPRREGFIYWGVGIINSRAGREVLDGMIITTTFAKRNALSALSTPENGVKKHMK